MGDEFDATPDDDGWDEGHPIFQMALENDFLRKAYIEREERLVKLIKHWRVTAPYCETVDDASALCDCADELEAILNR